MIQQWKLFNGSIKYKKIKLFSMNANPKEEKC